MKSFMLIVISMFLLACDKPGPLESAGEEIDEKVEDVKAGGETTANMVDDAIDEARKDINDAVKKVDPD